MWASSWHCHSMKSLNRLTPLVRMNMSSGGHPAVYVWLLIVSAVIVSLSLNWGVFVFPLGAARGESGFRVVDDMESSTSDLEVGSGDVSRSDDDEVDFFSCLDLISCSILACEKGVIGGTGGDENSSTVALIAAVISALEVYGKQMFRTALVALSVLVVSTVG